jgi:hypothetical protein
LDIYWAALAQSGDLCCVSYQVSFSWDSRSDQGSSGGDAIQRTFGFLTPSVSSGLSGSDTRITISVQIDTVEAKVEIPGRLVQ